MWNLPGPGIEPCQCRGFLSTVPPGTSPKVHFLRRGIRIFSHITIVQLLTSIKLTKTQYFYLIEHLDSSFVNRTANVIYTIFPLLGQDLVYDQISHLAIIFFSLTVFSLFLALPCGLWDDHQRSSSLSLIWNMSTDFLCLLLH